MKNALVGLEFKYRDADQLKQEWQAGFKAKHSIYSGTVSAAKGDGSYRLIEVRPNAKAAQVVMRLVSTDGAVAYHFITIRRNGIVGLQVVDYEVFGGGGNLSDILELMLRRYTVYEGADGKIVADAPNYDELVLEKRILVSFLQSLQFKQYQEALHFYSQLPNEMQIQKIIILGAIQSGGEVEHKLAGDPRFRPGDLMNDFTDTYRRSYPNDKVISLITIDYNVKSKNFEDARADIRQVKESVGDDPFLDLIEARVVSISGNSNEALQIAEIAFAKLLDIPQAYLILAEIAQDNGKFERTAEVLKLLEKQRGKMVDFKMFDDPLWKPFRESAAYREWIAKRQNGESR